MINCEIWFMKYAENDGVNGFSIEGLVGKLGAGVTVSARRMGINWKKFLHNLLVMNGDGEMRRKMVGDEKKWMVGRRSEWWGTKSGGKTG